MTNIKTSTDELLKGCSGIVNLKDYTLNYRCGVKNRFCQSCQARIQERLKVLEDEFNFIILMKEKIVYVENELVHYLIDERLKEISQSIEELKKHGN